MLTAPPSGHTADPGCDALRTESFAACDGELSTEQLALIDAHLQRCTGCRLRFANDTMFLHAVRRATSIEAAPAQLRDRVALLLLAHTAEKAST